MKYYKTLFLLIFMPIMAIADIDNEIKSYAGVNFQQIWVAGKTDFNRLFKKSEPGADIYFGSRINNYVGIEAGYAWTTRASNKVVVPSQTWFLSVLNSSLSNVTLTSQIRFCMGYVDANFFLPIPIAGLKETVDPELFLSLGIMSVTPKVKITTHVDPLVNASAFTSQFPPIAGRSKMMGRIGAGFQGMFSHSFGLRVYWRYLDFTKIELKSGAIDFNIANKRPFYAAQSCGIGMFMKF